MTSHELHLTPEQAREQLRTGRTRSLGSTGDRRVHAIGTAVCGLTIGVYLATQNVIAGAGRLALIVAFLAVFAAEATWVERAARTVPRRAGLWARLGVGSSIVLALVLVLPWLNLQAQTAPNSWPTVLVAALVVALPSLLAATAVARGRG